MKHGFNVPRNRGIPKLNIENGQLPKKSTNDLFFHLLFGRLALSDNDVYELETKYDKENNSINLIIKDEQLEIIESINIDSELRRFLDWLFGVKDLFPINAIDVLYDNSLSGLDAENLQEAVDELSQSAESTSDSSTSSIDISSISTELNESNSSLSSKTSESSVSTENVVSSSSESNSSSSLDSSVLDNTEILSAIAGTGILTGGQLTINTDNTKFDLSGGTGWIATQDFNNLTYQKITWGDFTAIDVDDFSNNRTFVAINGSGNIVQSSVDWTPQQYRSLIVIGSIVHITHTTIDFVGTIPHSLYQPIAQISDVSDSVGPINRIGNVYGPNDANLSIDKSAGETFRIGSNYANNEYNPNITVDSSISEVTFAYVVRDGSGGFNAIPGNTEVDHDHYDDGSGTLATVSSNKWTTQRIFYVGNQNTTFIHYGQTIYNSLAEAEADIYSEDVELEPNLKDATFRCWLLIKSGATDLSNLDDAKFITAGKFGYEIIAGGGTVINLQQAYNNSVEPEILTDNNRGAVTLRRGSDDDSDNLLELQNGNNDSVGSFNALGEATLISLSNTGGDSLIAANENGKLYNSGIDVGTIINLLEGSYQTIKQTTNIDIVDRNNLLVIKQTVPGVILTLWDNPQDGDSIRIRNKSGGNTTIIPGGVTSGTTIEDQTSYTLQGINGGESVTLYYVEEDNDWMWQ